MPRRQSEKRTLGPATEARNQVVASGTSHATPGTAVTVTLAGNYSDLTNAQLLTIARRDFRVVQTDTDLPAAAFNITAATAATPSINVTCTVASQDFEVVSG